MMDSSFLWEVSLKEVFKNLPGDFKKTNTRQARDRLAWDTTDVGAETLIFKPFLMTPALLYGYSVYTSFRFPLNAYWLNLHGQRLEENARQMDLEWPPAWKKLFEIDTVTHLLAQQGYQVSEAIALRLTVFADVNHYGEFYRQPEQALPSRCILSVRPLAGRAASFKDFKKISLKSVLYERPDSSVKRGDLMQSIRLKRQAQREGFDDILLINQEGNISESSTANIFFFDEIGVLYTPDPALSGCLPGITRQQVLEAAQQVNISISQSPVIPLKAMQKFVGAFFCNAIQGLIPISHIDEYYFSWPTAVQNGLALLLKTL